MMGDENAAAPRVSAHSPYLWMAIAAFATIVAGRVLLPFSSQQAQNISLIIDALGGAALGLAAFRRFRPRRAAGLAHDRGGDTPSLEP